MGRSHSNGITVDVEGSRVVEGNIEATARSCAFVVVTETDGVRVVEEEVGGCLSGEEQSRDEGRLQCPVLHLSGEGSILVFFKADGEQ